MLQFTQYQEQVHLEFTLNWVLNTKTTVHKTSGNQASEVPLPTGLDAFQRLYFLYTCPPLKICTFLHVLEAWTLVTKVI